MKNQKLATIMAKCGCTTADLAKGLKLSESEVNGWLYGRTPTTKHMRWLGDFLGIGADELAECFKDC